MNKYINIFNTISIGFIYYCIIDIYKNKRCTRDHIHEINNLADIIESINSELNETHKRLIKLELDIKTINIIPPHIEDYY